MTSSATKVRKATKSLSGKSSKINWPKPYTKYLARDQIRLALRIYWTDKLARKAIGKSTCTPGLIDRLTAEFNVPRKLIEHIVEARDKVGKDRFKDISIEAMVCDVKRRLRNRGAAL